MIDEIIEHLRMGRTDRVSDAIRCCLDTDVEAAARRDILMWIWFHGDVPALKRLLENGWELLELGDDLGLSGAAYHGHGDLCEFLLEAGADATIADKGTGETPLHAAICKANRPQYNRIVKQLLQRQADPNAKTIPGVETGAFMRDVRTKGETPLHRAAAYGDHRMISMLLSAGADKTVRDSHGDTPLSWASWHLRPGRILDMLCYNGHSVGTWHVQNLTSDHGRGWGNGMENTFL